jgi:hypothetical protein
MEWAILEWEQGDLLLARELFSQGSRVPRSYQHPPLYMAWAQREREAGEEGRAKELEEMYEQLLQRQGNKKPGQQAL